MKRLASWIRRAYIGAVLRLIGAAVRIEIARQREIEACISRAEQKDLANRIERSVSECLRRQV
ncbi:hypothetical protein E2K99_10295 [Herbaspirillum huttiense]|uniref:hypothetical protein n=1 Tax=Herbaspirillum huttiense TaxID=863372 RepID=UPI001064B425|nr:hypothetical protein [Herbaspirillum huttiense]QBP75377.1 hypothetical protein E2K99_10295 [Herbaspirillum huttiense]